MKKLFSHRLAEIRGLIDNYIEEKGEHKASIIKINRNQIHCMILFKEIIPYTKK